MTATASPQRSAPAWLTLARACGNPTPCSTSPPMIDLSPVEFASSTGDNGRHG